MRLFLPLALLLLTAALTAQDCFYQLRLEDSGGDGINGGEVTVTIDDLTRRFTLDAMNDDGSRRDFYFPVDNGDRVTIGYRAGAFPEEATLSIRDNNDSLIYTVQAPTTAAELTAFTARCRTCASPPLASIELFRLRYNSVDLRFRSSPAAASPSYLIEYGEGDFDPTTDEGTQLTIQDTMRRITGLQPQTTYNFYVSTICQNPLDTAARRGPFRIRTQRQRDIGVTVLQRPLTKCQPGEVDSVTVGITNFGGEAQQFFRLDFTINGQSGGVNFPFDGIYTGVLGVDSTEFFTFDVGADLTGAGVYTFQVFTMLEGDENPDNDTLTATVLSVPVITDYPYVESFETGTGFWRGERGGRGPTTWRRAEPTGSLIDRAGSGRFAFVTNPRGPYSNDELSYLRSPCFDFSGLDADPNLSFLLYVDTEENFDRLYLESSTDEGETWRRVSPNSTGVNWYNNLTDRAWDGDGGFNDRYALVSQQLSGLAGEEDVQLRFVFESDGDGLREGVAIDEIRITRRADTDLAAVRTELLGQADCDGDLATPVFTYEDTLAFTYLSLGTTQPDSARINYRVDGGPVATETIAVTGVADEETTVAIPMVSFQVTPPSSATIEAWITAPDDGVSQNDTTVLVYRPVLPVPFLVDFETGRSPRNWSFDPDLVIGTRGGNESATVSDRLDGQDTVAFFSTASYGPLEPEDSLVFEVTLTPVAGSGDPAAELFVSPDADCDNLPIAIEPIMLGPGTQRIALPLGGRSASFDFDATWMSGDYFIDFDNIAIRRCPGTLDVGLTTVPPSGIFADDGAAYLTPRAGQAPYTYVWSTGDTTQSVDSLSVEAYSVTVTDAFGCSETIGVDISLDAVSTDEPGELLAGLSVFPNPTEGRVEVRLALSGSQPVGIEVYDARGRRVSLRELGVHRELTTSVDLSDQPAGLYFLRVRAGGAARTVRVMRR